MKLNMLMIPALLLAFQQSALATGGWAEITESGATQSAYVGTVKTVRLLASSMVVYYMRGEYAEPDAEYASSVARYVGDCETGENQRLFYASFSRHGLYGSAITVDHNPGSIIEPVEGSVLSSALSTACTLAGVNATFGTASEPLAFIPAEDAGGDIDRIETMTVVTTVTSASASAGKH